MASSSLRRQLRRIPDALQRATQIELSNVPRTATPADIRRLVFRAQVQGVDDVSIDYYHLNPTGRAYLKLTHSDFLLPALDALEKITISGVHPTAEPSDRPSYATEYAWTEGNGLSSEIKSYGKAVAVWGYPKSFTPEALDRSLAGRFTFPQNEAYIFKLPGRETDASKPFTLYSRFFVRLDSVSEAHRFVRELHLTYHAPLQHQAKYSLHAHVIH
ncbi:hypothetical protein R3P38DRAFT_2998748 [Favolaschia claudopus]|uniref:Uncharacterized protein n=1 Tax=Favolaschia claudopus TaxID=2862362 RepID=A0AAW0AS97_9AGAR